MTFLGGSARDDVPLGSLPTVAISLESASHCRDAWSLLTGVGTKPGIHKLLAAGSSLAGERAKPPGGETGHKLKPARLNPVFAHRIFDYHTFFFPSGKKERGRGEAQVMCYLFSAFPSQLSWTIWVSSL